MLPRGLSRLRREGLLAGAQPKFDEDALLAEVRRRSMLPNRIHRDVYGISPLSHNSTRIVRRWLKREGMRTLSKRVQARLRGCGH